MTLRVAVAGVLLVSALACKGRPGPRHPEPDRAVAECRAGLAEGNPADAIPRMLTGCAGLYVEPTCRDAWLALAPLDPTERMTRITAAVTTCRDVYCPLLPEPRPGACPGGKGSDRWLELQRAIFTLDLGPERAEALARDLAARLTRRPAEPGRLDPPAACAGEITLVVAPHELAVGPTGALRRVADCGTEIDGAALAEELCRLRRQPGFACATGVSLAARPEVEYKRVIPVMDAAIAAGFPDIAMVDALDSPLPPPDDLALPRRCGKPVIACPPAAGPRAIALPAAAHALEHAPVVSIDAAGALRLDGKPLASTAALADALRAHAGRAEGVVVLQVDERCPAARLDEIIRAAATAGYSNVEYAVGH